MSQQIHEEIRAIQKHLALSEGLLDAMRPQAKEQHWFLLAEAMCLSTVSMLKIVEKSLVMDDAKVAASEPPMQTAQFKIGDRVACVASDMGAYLRSGSVVSVTDRYIGVDFGDDCSATFPIRHANRFLPRVHPDQRGKLPSPSIPNCERCKRPLLWNGSEWVCEDMMCVGAAVCDEIITESLSRGTGAGSFSGLGIPAFSMITEPTFREGDEVVYDPDRDIAGRLFWEKTRGIVRCVDAGVIGVRFDGFVTWYFTHHRARKTLLLKVPKICADSGQTLSFEERHKRIVEVTYRDGAIEGTMIGLPTGICYDDRYGWLLSLRSPDPNELGRTVPFSQILYWRPARRTEEKGANGQAVNLATGKSVAPKSPAD